MNDVGMGNLIRGFSCGGSSFKYWTLAVLFTDSFVNIVRAIKTNFDCCCFADLCVIFVELLCGNLCVEK